MATSACYQKVKCKKCGRVYICKPGDDYFNSTNSTDGVCLGCLTSHVSPAKGEFVMIVERPKN